MLGETSGTIIISKGEKKYSLNLFVNLLQFWPTCALHTDRRCKFINPTSEVFVVIVNTLLFSSEMVFYGVTGFDSDSKIGAESS